MRTRGDLRTETYEFFTHDEKQKKSPEAGTQSSRLSKPFQCRKTLDPYAADDGQDKGLVDQFSTPTTIVHAKRRGKWVGSAIHVIRRAIMAS